LLGASRWRADSIDETSHSDRHADHSKTTLGKTPELSFCLH
jgi:hypothetical protein